MANDRSFWQHRSNECFADSGLFYRCKRNTSRWWRRSSMTRFKWTAGTVTRCLALPTQGPWFVPQRKCWLHRRCSINALPQSTRTGFSELDKHNRSVVRPSVLESAKLAIYAEMLAQGVKKSELARRLGWHMPQVDRLLDLNHASRMEHLESAARSLGREIRLSMV